MSAALKRRLNFEQVQPIPDLDLETALVRRQAMAALERVHAPVGLDESVLQILVTTFRDLRTGSTAEGWEVERPSTVMSTAEAVSVASSIGLACAYFPDGGDPLAMLPGHLMGVVRKDDPADAARLLGYWDGAVRRRAADGGQLWHRLWQLRDRLEH